MGGSQSCFLLEVKEGEGRAFKIPSTHFSLTFKGSPPLKKGAFLTPRNAKETRKGGRKEDLRFLTLIKFRDFLSSPPARWKFHCRQVKNWVVSSEIDTKSRKKKDFWLLWLERSFFSLWREEEEKIELQKRLIYFFWNDFHSSIFFYNCTYSWQFFFHYSLNMHIA